MSQNSSSFCTEEYTFNYLVFTETSDEWKMWCVGSYKLEKVRKREKTGVISTTV